MSTSAAEGSVAPFNSSFSSQLPTLQLGIDSTSIGEFKICPRRYQLGILQGWQPQRLSVDLTFGIAVHKAFETYYKLRAGGSPHEDALATTVRAALVATWDSSLSRPIAGLEDSAKNRLGLLRAVVWGLDEMNREQEDSLETATLPNGQPAVELSFRFASGLTSTLTGEPFLLCGHLDRVVRFNGGLFVSDLKTTRHDLGSRWLDNFTPDNQFSFYTFAGQIILHEPVLGLIVEGLQIGVNFVRGPRRAFVPRPRAVIDEWSSDLAYWLKALEDCVEADSWPMNDKACGLFGGCPFRSVCSRAPSARELHLQTNFHRRIWDPLQARL